MLLRGDDNSQTSPAGGDERILAQARRLLAGEAAGLTATWWMQLDPPAAYWSPEMFAIYGVDPGTEPSRELMRAAVHPSDRAETLRAGTAWEADPRGCYHGTFRIVRPDGGARLLEMRAWMADALGRPQPGAGRAEAAGCPQPRVIGTVIDVTAAGRLANERTRADEQRELVLQVSEEGICGLDPGGRIVFANPAFGALVRRGPAELVGARLHDLVHRDADGRERHAAGDCPYHPGRRGRAREIDAGFVAGDGTRLEVSYVRVAVDADPVLAAVISLRDETEQRAASRRLRASLEHVRALSVQRGALLRQLAGAEERERLRIAADIHDDSVQTLRAVELGLERRRDLIEDPALGRLLEEARLDVHAAATRLRGLMLELLPPVPELPLVAAIAAYCQSQFDGTDFVYEVHGESEELEPDTYLLAYRLAQEAVRNARKHSRGTRVSIAVSSGRGRLVLEVADDGIGLGDLGGHGPRGGLRIIRQRIAAAGGESGFGPGPGGRGTQVRIELPLDEDWGT
ncbi:MAG TPA: PAS domain-containing protein [Solirubrobacteraceae bacterium]|nr:PAS domain-containing protein [Solirubrobacteraceae bacterium]